MPVVGQGETPRYLLSRGLVERALGRGLLQYEARERILLSPDEWRDAPYEAVERILLSLVEQARMTSGATKRRHVIDLIVQAAICSAHLELESSHLGEIRGSGGSVGEAERAAEIAAGSVGEAERPAEIAVGNSVTGGPYQIPLPTITVGL